MELGFEQPWLVIAAAALALGAAVVAVRVRRVSTVLFVLAAGAFFLAGARPHVAQPEPRIVHALAVDTSDSTRTRSFVRFADEVAAMELPRNHSFARYELSDALRPAGSASGPGTAYGRLGDFPAEDDISGEVLFITDGRGDLDAMLRAVPPGRLILLRAPPPEAPDASVIGMQAPTWMPAPAKVSLRATVLCDMNADVPWRILRDGAEVASGTRNARASTPVTIHHNLYIREEGLSLITLRLDLPGDREPGNDEASVRVLTGGKRHIEYCTPPGIPPETDAMLQYLQRDERNEVRVRHDLPISRRELQGVGAVFINNLSLAGSGATRAELQVLAGWVREGGNLVMLGTDGAFGPGGYRHTPLEEIMPVRFRPDDAPPRRTLLLLDVSDSMNDLLPGGERKLQRLKTAAHRFVEVMDEGDQAAVVGFRERLTGEITFRPAGSETLTNAIDGLRSGGSTHIGSSLSSAVKAMPEDSRILMITDGDDMEGARPETYEAIAATLKTTRTRLDVVLTTDARKEWINLLGDAAQTWSVGGAGFQALLETLERALAGAEQEWVINEPTDVFPIQTPLPRLVRTALRDDPSVEEAVGVTSPHYPVLARRDLVGRTVAICTDSWGGAPMSTFWSDLHIHLLVNIDWLLENANPVNLVMNRLEGLEPQAELVWTGAGEPPTANLATDAGEARLESTGRWLLDALPEGEELRVFDGERLLQRIPLPSPVPAELRLTGDDHAFFAEAEGAGVRVVSGLDAWQPRRYGEARVRATDITWVPTLLAMLLLLAGFALRRR